MTAAGTPNLLGVSASLREKNNMFAQKRRDAEGAGT